MSMRYGYNTTVALQIQCRSYGIQRPCNLCEWGSEGEECEYYVEADISLLRSPASTSGSACIREPIAQGTLARPLLCNALTM